VLVDINQLSRADWDDIGASLEAGVWIGLGALPTDRTPALNQPTLNQPTLNQPTLNQLSPDQVARRVLGPLGDLGLEPPVAVRIVITPACGLASTSRDDAIRALRTLRSAAKIVTEQLAD
jgi:hypothetical protein